MKDVKDMLGNLMVVCVVGFVFLIVLQVLALTALEEILAVLS